MSIHKSVYSISIGIVLGGLTFILSSFLSEELILGIHTVLLGQIGSIYVGFSIADGRLFQIILQSSGALLFLLVSIIGLILYPMVLAGGYFAHGIWDLVHHRSHVPGRFAGWYVPFCTSYDWTVGAYLLYLFWPEV